MKITDKRLQYLIDRIFKDDAITPVIWGHSSFQVPIMSVLQELQELRKVKKRYKDILNDIEDVIALHSDKEE